MAAETTEPAIDSPPLIECDLPLGQSGLTAHNRLTLSGWAIAPAGIGAVVVRVDERTWTASYGLDTPALPGRLPGTEGAHQAGFRLVLDTSRWEPGIHEVTIEARDREGRSATIEGPVEVRPFEAPSPPTAEGPGDTEAREMTLELDSPAIEDGKSVVEGALRVRGWAHAKAGVEAVLVTLDGILQYEALRPIARPDLLSRFGQEVASEAGFALVVDSVELPPGRHTLEVAALSRDGHAIGVECELECRPAPSAALTSEANGETRAPELREDGEERSDAERAWEERVLSSEADAALSRTEARLAVREQERVLRDLRRIEADAGPLVAKAISELAATRQSLMTIRSEAIAAEERESLAHSEASKLTEELELGRSALNLAVGERDSTQAALREAQSQLNHHQALLDSVEKSVSWRLTRPLRAAKRLLRRDGANV